MLFGIFQPRCLIVTFPLIPSSEIPPPKHRTRLFSLKLVLPPPLEWHTNTNHQPHSGINPPLLSLCPHLSETHGLYTARDQCHFHFRRDRNVSDTFRSSPFPASTKLTVVGKSPWIPLRHCWTATDFSSCIRVIRIVIYPCSTSLHSQIPALVISCRLFLHRHGH